MTLKQDVIAELSWDPSINAAALGVEVRDGVVSLVGRVDSYGEKWRAERAAQRVNGVRAVAVDIEVMLFGASARSDGDIARAVENVLQWGDHLPANDTLKVMVEDGWVTLSGKVEWDYERRAVLAIVRNLMGVKGVSDEIVIEPRVSLTAVKAEIEAALKRRANADSNNIDVDVHAADVTLNGTVHSWMERELASESAWATPGVKHVINNITIAV